MLLDTMGAVSQRRRTLADYSWNDAGRPPDSARSIRLCQSRRKDWVAKWAQDAESMINILPGAPKNPDQMGPIVRNTADGRKQLVHGRWGLPSPLFALRKKRRRRQKTCAPRAGRSTSMPCYAIRWMAAPRMSAPSISRTGSVGLVSSVAALFRSPVSRNPILPARKTVAGLPMPGSRTTKASP